jgi:Winged helix DNA-binding domain
MRTLTQRELNRALLARQLLLERTKLSLPRALERIAGIQNQYAPNAYIRLWSCLEGFRRDDLDRALARRTVVQGTLMRGTIHLVSRRDYPLFAAAIRRSGQEWLRRVDKVPDLDFDSLARELRASLRGRTMTLAELKEFPRGVVHWVDLVRVPPGTWEKRRAHTFGLAEEWVGSLEVEEGAAMEHLVRRYLAAFGPASNDDVTKFTGIPRTRAKPVVERVGVRRFRDADGKRLYDVARAPLPDADTVAPVRFLPTWDSTLLAHARRTGIVDEQYRDVIFNTKVPPSFPTFLVDGRIVGTWKYEDGGVKLDPFEPIPRKWKRELDQEAKALAALHA